MNLHIAKIMILLLKKFNPNEFKNVIRVGNTDS